MAAANRNLRTAGLASCVALAMLALSFASVPLYRLFCEATGFGGTTQRADAAPARQLDRRIGIRFDANIAASLGWTFSPAQFEMTIKPGEQALAFYRATNTSDRELTGSAVFNVTPESAGAYFTKIECFCFTEQTLKAGETVDMPVVFFVDPAIAEDADTKAIDTITLSYTFYPVDKPKSLSAVTPPAETNTN